MTTQPLSDADLARLQDLLDRVPAPLEPLDVMALDGYLCGVLLQPQPVPAERWLTYVRRHRRPRRCRPSSDAGRTAGAGAAPPRRTGQRASTDRAVVRPLDLPARRRRFAVRDACCPGWPVLPRRWTCFPALMAHRRPRAGRAAGAAVPALRPRRPGRRRRAAGRDRNPRAAGGPGRGGAGPGARADADRRRDAPAAPAADAATPQARRAAARRTAEHARACRPRPCATLAKRSPRTAARRGKPAAMRSTSGVSPVEPPVKYSACTAVGRHTGQARGVRARLRRCAPGRPRSRAAAWRFARASRCQRRSRAGPGRCAPRRCGATSILACSAGRRQRVAQALFQHRHQPAVVRRVGVPGLHAPQLGHARRARRRC